MEEAKVGYFSFNANAWRNVSVQCVDFVKRLTARQSWDLNKMKCLQSDPWLKRRREDRHVSLNIDVLDNLKKINKMFELETLILMVKNNERIDQNLFEFTMLLQSNLNEEMHNSDVSSSILTCERTLKRIKSGAAKTADRTAWSSNTTFCRHCKFCTKTR